MFILIAAVIATVAYLINGLAVKLLWGWFMTTAFNLPALSIPQAIGLGIIVAFLTHQHIPRKERSDQLGAATSVLIGPAMAILVGWIVYQFI